MAKQNTKLSGYNPNRRPSSIPSYLGLPRISSWKKFANFLGPDTPNKLKCDCFCTGRSMVEMLGVLAIVGVLSVGAIAGYGKAMMKYKLNKQAEQIGFIIDYIIANQDRLRTVPYKMKDTLNKLGIVSDNMIKDNSEYAYDIFNSKIKLENHARSTDGQIGGGYAIGIEINSSSQAVEICRNLVIMSKERADDIYAVYVQRTETSGTNTSSTAYYGNKTNQDHSNYLRDLDMVKIDNSCKVCEEAQSCFVFALIGYTNF